MVRASGFTPHKNGFVLLLINTPSHQVIPNTYMVHTSQLLAGTSGSIWYLYNTPYCGIQDKKTSTGPIIAAPSISTVKRNLGR